ncbi:aspartate kinase [Spirochaeta isovalerica]|uniref:Aspartokinase n=1 Tax=Spirochaeta isovalerica TaxID=150 RepID=A0A841R3P9_9SPIO|nr:aspartate kinase [Spirochaeta isovalerica]MBB6478446.1 aspartate kinase/aspartokinase/homoserine dehydrogenase 1 [Spirochaeta isovalerica]
MKKIVVKFGGSNLKSKEDITKIIKTIEGYNRPLVIVVSAFYGITNYLTEGLETARRDESHVGEIITFLKKLKKETLEENISDPGLQEEAYNLVKERLEELEKYLLGIHYIGEIPDFVEDRVLSYGEKLSSLLLSLILKSHGIEAVEAQPEEIGLVTDGAFRNASIDFERSRNSVSQALNNDTIYIVPGFYGVSPDRKITLLGRGGSDYSAAAIASCIDAEYLDVWKDVNGYMSADPGLIPGAVRVKNLSYNEAAELSYFGAKILHPRTVEPLLDQGIPVRVFNINRAGIIDPLSIIGPDETIGSTLKSVTYSDAFAVLKLEGAGVGIKEGILARVTTLFDRNFINIKSVVTSQTAINIYLESPDLDRAVSLLKENRVHTITAVVPYDNLSIIALVGDGLIHSQGLAYRMIGAVAEQGIDLKIVSIGASDSAAYCVVDRNDREEAVRVIHRTFFEGL